MQPFSILENVWDLYKYLQEVMGLKEYDLQFLDSIIFWGGCQTRIKASEQLVTKKDVSNSSERVNVNYLQDLGIHFQDFFFIAWQLLSRGLSITDKKWLIGIYLILSETVSSKWNTKHR